jgi:ribonuclease BN (tRNA processing enzyme)
MGCFEEADRHIFYPELEMPDTVKIIECPRDARQGLPAQIPPEHRGDRLCRRIAAARGSKMRRLRPPIYALLTLVSASLACTPQPANAQSCGSSGLAVQVLGSGGPETEGKRASTSYLIWQNGLSRVIVDAGGGSALRFGESGAKMSQLDVFLFSHFHVDHSSDFPALVFSSWFGDRSRPLPVYGPSGNDFMPSTTEFVRDLFSDPRGAWRYLSDMVEPNPQGTYQLQPHNVAPASVPALVFRNADMAVYAVSVGHGAFPALAWRVEIGGKQIVFGGDTNGEGQGLTQLASNADIFIAHNAVPEGATGVERRLHMPPSVIGAIAANAHVKQLVLSHRMLRTLGKEEETQFQIRRRFSGPIRFANDLECFPLE